MILALCILAMLGQLVSAILMGAVVFDHRQSMVSAWGAVILYVLPAVTMLWTLYARLP